MPRKFPELSQAAAKMVTQFPNAGHIAGLVSELATACQALQVEVHELKHQLAEHSVGRPRRS